MSRYDKTYKKSIVTILLHSHTKYYMNYKICLKKIKKEEDYFLNLLNCIDPIDNIITNNTHIGLPVGYLVRPIPST